MPAPTAFLRPEPRALRPRACPALCAAEKETEARVAHCVGAEQGGADLNPSLGFPPGFSALLSWKPRLARGGPLLLSPALATSPGVPTSLHSRPSELE